MGRAADRRRSRYQLSSPFVAYDLGERSVGLCADYLPSKLPPTACLFCNTSTMLFTSTNWVVNVDDSAVTGFPCCGRSPPNRRYQASLLPGQKRPSTHRKQRGIE